MKKLGPINPDIENWDVLLLACGKIDDLIDLVNSQQEAIEKLAERLELTERRARYACLHALKRENEELADDKPVSCRKCMTNTHIELCCPKSYTHRTVTLRIPKGKRIGQAISNAAQGYPLYISDTDLQKALDEVQPNE